MAENRCEPRIGEWYKNEQGVSFEVISIDEEEQLIEIQYFDGSVEELAFDSWNQSDITSREPPEEWSFPFDDLNLEDFDDTGEGLHPNVWCGPLDGVDFETERGE